MPRVLILPGRSLWLAARDKMGKMSADNMQLVFAGSGVNVQLENAGHAVYMDDRDGWHEALMSFLGRVAGSGRETTAGKSVAGDAGATGGR